MGYCFLILRHTQFEGKTFVLGIMIVNNLGKKNEKYLFDLNGILPPKRENSECINLSTLI